MQTRFYIERRKDGAGNLMLKDRPVFMSVSFPGERLMISTGVKADFIGWDPERQRMKSSFPGSLLMNSWFESLSATAHQTWSEIQTGSERPDGRHFREAFKRLKPMYSNGYFDVFFMFLESGLMRWSTSTYKKVRTIYKHLREFEDSSVFEISFRNMNSDFIDQFKNFYSEKGNSPATTRKAINIIVWFLNWATEQGFNVNLEFRKFYKLLGKNTGSTIEPLFLQWEEVQKLAGHFCNNKRKERVRDLFCLMCFTGLRYSELQALKKEDGGNGTFLIRGNNRKQRKVELNVHARKIYNLYENKYYLNNAAFPAMSIVTMNKYLRIIAEEAGLKRLVEPAKGTVGMLPIHLRISAGMGVYTFRSTLTLKLEAESKSNYD